MSSIETAIRLTIPSEKASLLTEKLLDIESVGRFSSIYFDTDQFDLRALDVELSIRKNGSKVLQTIKTPLAMAGPFAKRISRYVLDSDEPSRKYLTGISSSKRLSEIDKDALRSTFSTSFDHITGHYRRAEGNADVLVSVKVGSIEQGAQKHSLDQVELSLHRGPLVGLYDAALTFTREFDGRLSIDGPMSSADLAFGQHTPLYWKSPKPRLDPASSLRDAVQQGMRHAYTQILKNYVPMISQGDIEAVHQMRIGIRRLRSLIFAFKPIVNLKDAGPLLDYSRKLFGQLGNLRELDVFITDVLPQALASLDEPTKRRLVATIQARRGASYARLKSQLSSPEFSEFALKLGRWIEAGDWQELDSSLDRLWYLRPLRVFAQARLTRLHRIMMKLGKSKRKGNFQDWHELRIVTKRMRYTAELFAVLFPGKRANAHNRKLASWQVRLGELNDIAASKELLQKLERSAPTRDAHILRDARLYFSGWSQVSAKKMEKSLVARWEKFSRSQPYWLETWSDRKT